MFELSFIDYDKTRPLFEAMDYHLALSAILAGSTPARVFVDDPDHPRAAFVWSGHRFCLAGSPGRTGDSAASLSWPPARDSNRTQGPV